MFEKEAEEYGEKDLGGKYLSSVVAKDKLHAYKLGQYDGFVAGAEFGYNKANEWQFLKTKDDLPKPRDTRRVLTWYGRNIKEGKPVILDANRFDVGGAVIAWKEIVLPKESE